MDDPREWGERLRSSFSGDREEEEGAVEEFGGANESNDDIEDPDQSKVSKPDAEYTTDPGEVGAPPEARCGGCAHFIPASETAIDTPMCKIVAGEILGDAVCRRFYSDLGIFVDNDFEDPVRITSVLERGGLDDWDQSDEDAFLTQVEAALRMGNPHGMAWSPDGDDEGGGGGIY